MVPWLADVSSRAKKKLAYWYKQYELILCINIFEPWEKVLLNTVVIGIAAMMCYSSYVYLPNYMDSLIKKSLLFIQKNEKEV